MVKRVYYSFVEAKKLLVSAPVLAYFDLSLPFKLVGDTSAYGIGAAISNVFTDEQRHPIAFTSHTLSKAEKIMDKLRKKHFL